MYFTPHVYFNLENAEDCERYVLEPGAKKDEVPENVDCKTKDETELQAVNQFQT